MVQKTRPRVEQELEEFFRRYNAVHELRLAVKRMDGSPTERLKWVLDFARRDLDLLQPGEREALGFDLRGLVVHSLGGQPGYKLRRTPMPDADLRRYQKAIADAIEALLSDEPKEWSFPATARVVVAESRRPNRRRFEVRLGGDEEASVLGGVANLIVQTGEQLRRCLHCGKPFVATRKDEYCSPAHAQSARDKRRQPKGDRR